MVVVNVKDRSKQLVNYSRTSLGQRTNVAIIHYNCSLRNEYICIRSIIPVHYRDYNLLLVRAQMIGRLLLEWRTQQALEYEKKNRQYTNEEIFQDDQMVQLLAPHSSALQTYHQIQARFYWSIIHRHSFRQDTL